MSFLSLLRPSSGVTPTDPERIDVEHRLEQTRRIFEALIAKVQERKPGGPS